MNRPSSYISVAICHRHKRDNNMHIGKVGTAMNRLSIKRKSKLTDEIKLEFFHAAVLLAGPV